ncbi:MAG TPA: hypothetical protein VH092_08655 [Urbifossiella sp.]|nr:hypothetical protein [Urbifossiella sp.]
MQNNLVQKYQAAVARMEDARRRFAVLSAAVGAVARVLGELSDPTCERTTLVHEMSSNPAGSFSSLPWPTVRDINQGWGEIWRTTLAAREAWDAIPPGLRVLPGGAAGSSPAAPPMSREPPAPGPERAGPDAPVPPSPPVDRSDHPSNPPDAGSGPPAAGLPEGG